MEQELLRRAIQSAQNRIHKLSDDINTHGGVSAKHQRKAENQIEIAETTIDALEKQIKKKPVYKNTDDKHIRPYCPRCDSELRYANFVVRICDCGQKIDWGEFGGFYVNKQDTAPIE